MHTPRAELLTIQKKLYLRNKGLIDNSILVKEPGFEGYEAAYSKYVRDYARVATQEEMIDAVMSSDIIFVGDYHTCNQSQRSFLRILKAVVQQDPDFVIGLELIHKRHQNVVNRYLAGRLTNKTFLEKIGLREHWIFDLWENFRPLFDFSRYHGVAVYGIDAAPYGASIKERDRASADILADIIEKNPNRRMFVFIGDLHIAPPHLPKDLSLSLKRKGIEKRQLILYENSEKIYWRLAEEGLDDQTEVALLKDGNFCRMHTPPIICQQSYLNWLEHEEGEIDYADAKASFLELVDRITSFLRIKLSKERDDVEVFTCGDLSFLKRLRESGMFTKQEMEVVKRQILSSESYYIAKTRYVYLANLSMNHAAEEAAHFIKHLCTGEEKPREFTDAFYTNILHEALGFFGSKLINHKRKCYHEKEFKELLTYFQTIHVPVDRRVEEETAHLVLECKKYERRGKALCYAPILHQKMDLFLSVTHALGYMLGDSLYYGMLQRAILRREIRKLFFEPWLEPGDSCGTYLELAHKLRRVKIPKRM